MALECARRTVRRSGRDTNGRSSMIEKPIATPVITGSADTAPANGTTSAGTTSAGGTAPADRTKRAPAVPAHGVHVTPQERAARGKMARAAVPRAGHAVWVAPA